MGELVSLETGTRLQLRPNHRIGRSRSSDLCLESPTVSTDHAAIRWTAQGWVLIDLASRNGTLMDGNSVAPGTAARLQHGSLLEFGTSREQWRVESLSAPYARATCCETRFEVVEQAGLILLDADDSPDPVCIHRTSRGVWLMERMGMANPIADGQTIQVGMRNWSLCLPDTHVPTMTARSELDINELVFDFHVSTDEESVHLQARNRHQTVDLGTHSFHYTMLTLARLRLHDAHQGTAQEGEHGWISAKQLARDLRIDENKLNVDIFRMRKQLARAGIIGAQRIIQRQRGTKKLRIGVDRLEVHRQAA